jgi:hypothetical protein
MASLLQRHHLGGAVLVVDEGLPEHHPAQQQEDHDQYRGRRGEVDQEVVGQAGAAGDDETSRVTGATSRTVVT